MAIRWNIVNHTGEAYDLVREKVQAKMQHIERLLVHFPDDAVQLQVALDEHIHSRQYQVTFNLSVPSNILHADSTSESMTRALDDAAAGLERQLKKLKDKLQRRGKRGRSPDSPAALLVGAPLPEGEGPQRPLELLRDCLKDSYSDVQSYAARHLRVYEQSGLLSEGALDADDAVDRAVQTILRHPGLKPAEMGLRAWFIGITYHEVRRMVRAYLQEQNTALPLELEVPLDRAHRLVEEHGAENDPMDAARDLLDPVTPHVDAFIAAAETGGEELEPVDSGILERLAEVSRDWPPQEKELLELLYGQGLDREEVGLLLSWSPEEIEAVDASIRRRLKTSGLSNG